MFRFFFLLCSSLLALTACSRYQFTLNEQVLYDPPALFTQFKVADTALQTCLEQSIFDQKVSEAAQLRTISCRHAGINTLDGIQLFSGLEVVVLADNDIRDLTPLLHLGQLQKLDLANNSMVSASGLINLPSLDEVNLSGNANLACEVLLGAKRTWKLTLPQHCLTRSSP